MARGRLLLQRTFSRRQLIVRVCKIVSKIASERAPFRKNGAIFLRTEVRNAVDSRSSSACGSNFHEISALSGGV